MIHKDALDLSRSDFLEKYGDHKEWLFDKVHGILIQEILKESLNQIAKDKERNKLMGRVKNWLIEMEEAATFMTLPEWIKVYGTNQREVWERVNSNDEQYDLGL